MKSLALSKFALTLSVLALLTMTPSAEAVKPKLEGSITYQPQYRQLTIKDLNRNTDRSSDLNQINSLNGSRISEPTAIGRFEDKHVIHADIFRVGYDQPKRPGTQNNFIPVTSEKQIILYEI